MVWIHCQDLETERRVRHLFESAQDQFPDDVCYLFSYDKEIEMMHPKKFLELLEGIVEGMREVLGTSLEGREE